MMDEIQDEFLEFVTALEKFSDRLVVISKKRFKVLKALLEGKPYYETDEETVVLYNEAKEKYRKGQDHLNEFYQESVISDYYKLVEFRLKRRLKEPIKDREKLTVSLANRYDVDVDFLRYIGSPGQIPKVKNIYLKYMQELDLDTSGILNNPNERYFTSPVPTIFDTHPYLHMSAIELSQEVAKLELASIKELLPLNSYKALKNIMESIGLIPDEQDEKSKNSELEEEGIDPSTGVGSIRKMT